MAEIYLTLSLSDSDYDLLVSNKTYSFFIETMKKFAQAATNKFIAGQKEHGGDFISVPMLENAKAEHIDLLFYLAGLEAKLKRDTMLDATKL